MVTLVAISCNNNNGKTEKNNKDSVSSSNTTAPETLDSAAIAKIVDHLKTLEPVDSSILLSIFPESVLNIKKTNIKSSEELISLNEFDAEYKGENKTINIHIIDGGSTQNDAYMTTRYYLNEIHLTKYDNQIYEIEKSETINNIKVYETQKNSDGEISSSIHFVINNRFGIQIDGTNTTLDELKPIIGTLNLAKLK